jgi:hypothetical protein
MASDVRRVVEARVAVPWQSSPVTRLLVFVHPSKITGVLLASDLIWPTSLSAARQLA